MNIHEHQAKTIFRDYDVPVPRGHVAFSVEEAVAAAEKLGGDIFVVKAQIHAGGRGKGGGVKLARSIDEVREIAGQILDMQLITHQTGPEGQKVRRLYIEEGVDIAREFYFGMVVDRASGKIAVMASTEGGIEIETVAEESPELIHTVLVEPALGFTDYQGRKLAFALGLEGKSVRKAGKVFASLYKCFVETDCSLCEVNPLVVTGSGDIIALDGKMNFDDNALYRHPDIEALRDESEEDAVELEAKQADLSYVNLDGNIGCMVNGAGLAMATMDIIKHYGAEPANFLDVGGGADAARVATAFKLITRDENVKGIFINIFGGIMKCDVLAEGVIAAVKEVGLEVPLVVRLEGTNVERGKEILKSSDLNIISVDSMGEGAQKIIEAIG